MPIHPQRPPVRAALLGLATLTLASLATAQDQRSAARLPAAVPSSSIDVPRIRYSQFTLANGLRVVLSEDHSSPLVAIELWYDVGSKHDPKGKSGLAHMFEHMMDEGTLNMPAPAFKRAIQAAGGYYNASTTNDWTRYNMLVPSNQLETALWLEAERMANLAPTLDSTRFNLEREAVRNEYRQRVLDIAVSSAAVSVFEALFSEGAYAVPVMGEMSELANATVDDLKTFYETYYVPNNAVLVVTGDFVSADARRKIEKHFGPIPRGKPVVHPKAIGPLVGEKRLVLEHPTNIRQLWTVWRGASSTARDRSAALALASITTDRLRKILVDERRIANVLNPGWNTNFDLQEGGVIQFVITLLGPSAKTESGTEAEQVIDSVVASIQRDGVTSDELRRYVARYRTQALVELQADTMKAYYLGEGLINMKNPTAQFDRLGETQRLTLADVQAAARKYFTADRVVMSVIPSGKLELRSKPELPYTNASRKSP
jgi:zinc protease